MSISRHGSTVGGSLVHANSANNVLDAAAAPKPITDATKRYVRQNLIGRGASKEVYRALDEEGGMEVAWNEIDLSLCTDVNKVRREVELLRKMNHPNVIRCFCVWEDVERRAIVFITELMTSGTLTDFISQQSTQTLKKQVMIKFSRQILFGLQYLHAQDVIHRDLKCNNIFINGNKGEVKIGDLGLSIAGRAATSVIGTPEFMAPEMFEEQYTNAVDIWSFGMCVVEMMTGKKPYSECDNVGQIYKKVSSGILPAWEVDDAEINDVILLCLSLDASKRPSAEQLLAHDLFARAIPAEVDDGASADNDAPGECEYPSRDHSADKDGLPLLIPAESFGAIMAWLRAAPSCIRGDALAVALQRGWIDAGRHAQLYQEQHAAPPPIAVQPTSLFVDPVAMSSTSSSARNGPGVRSGNNSFGNHAAAVAVAAAAAAAAAADDPFDTVAAPALSPKAGSGSKQQTPMVAPFASKGLDPTAIWLQSVPPAEPSPHPQPASAGPSSAKLPPIVGGSLDLDPSIETVTSQQDYDKVLQSPVPSAAATTRLLLDDEPPEEKKRRAAESEQKLLALMAAANFLHPS